MTMCGQQLKSKPPPGRRQNAEEKKKKERKNGGHGGAGRLSVTFGRAGKHRHPHTMGQQPLAAPTPTRVKSSWRGRAGGGSWRRQEESLKEKEEERTQKKKAWDSTVLTEMEGRKKCEHGRAHDLILKRRGKRRHGKEEKCLGLLGVRFITG